jgi:hypothetical protein
VERYALEGVVGCLGVALMWSESEQCHARLACASKGNRWVSASPLLRSPRSSGETILTRRCAHLEQEHSPSHTLTPLCLLSIGARAAVPGGLSARSATTGATGFLPRHHARAPSPPRANTGK